MHSAYIEDSGRPHFFPPIRALFGKTGRIVGSSLLSTYTLAAFWLPAIRRKQVTLFRKLFLSAAALSILPGCAHGQVFLQPPHGWDFNPVIDRNLAPTDGVVPDGFLNDGAMPPLTLLSPLYPELTGNSLNATNAALRSIPGSECLWVPAGQELRLSWEVTAQAFSPDLDREVTIGMCTATHPRTRAPIADSQGRPVLTAAGKVDTPQHTVELVQCTHAPTGTNPFNYCSHHPYSTCTPVSAGCTQAITPPGAPFCQQFCSVFAEEDSRYEVRVVKTTEPGLSTDGFRIERTSHIRPMIRAVDTGAVFARPMQALDPDVVIFPGMVQEGMRALTWSVPDLPDGKWHETFTPDIAVSRVQLFEFDTASGRRTYLPIDKLLFGTDNEVFGTDTEIRCSGPVIVRSNCPPLARTTPASHHATPELKTTWVAIVPRSTSNNPVYVEFTVANTMNETGLMASPSPVDLGDLYGGSSHRFTDAVSLENLNPSAVELSRLYFDGPDAALFSVATAAPVIVDGHSLRTLDLDVQAITDDMTLWEDKAADLVVETNLAPPHDTLRVPVSVRPTGSVEVLPEHIWLCLDSRQQLSGSCHSTRNFMVTNPGNATLVIDDVSFDEPFIHGLSLSAVASPNSPPQPLRFPYRVPRGGDQLFQVTYTGSFSRIDDLRVIVKTSFGEGSIEISAESF